MKKQYLIGLLGLIALSIPLGNSLLSSINNQALKTDNNMMVYDDNNKTDMAITKQPYDVSKTSASIDYDVELYFMNETSNTSDEINTITWYEDDSRENELASKDYTNEDPINKTKSVVGTLETNELVAEETYNTILVLDYQDAIVDENREIVEEVDTFGKQEMEASSITANVPTIEASINEEKNDKGYTNGLAETKAYISFEIEGVKTTEIKSINLMSCKDEIGFGGTEEMDPKLTGNFGPHDLIPDTEYQPYVKVVFNDTNLEPIVSDNVVFKTLPHTPIEKPSFESEPVARNITETEATINYKINPGVDNHNEPYIIEKVEWIDNADHSAEDDEFGTFTTMVNIGNNSSGNFIATGLTPNTTYKTIIKISYKNNDGISGSTISNEIEFTTISHPIELTSITSTLETITSDSTKVSYEIDPGKDSYNQPFEIKKVEWVDNANHDDGDGTYGNFETITNTGNSTTGNFTANDLTPDTDYKTIINVTFVDDSKDTSTPVEFTTDDADIVTPEINLINTETTLNSVTFSYEANDGLDSKGEPYFLAEIEVFDGETSMGSIGDENAIAADALDKTGTITINGLESDTIYEGWTMTATFTHSEQNDHSHEKEGTIIEPFSTLKAEKDGVRWWLIILTTLTVLIIINFILWLIADFYVENKIKTSVNDK